VDAAAAYARYQAYHLAVMQGLVASCHDLSDGGLAVAAAESAFAGGFGMSIDLSSVPWTGTEGEWRDDALLFSESASRLLVTVKKEHTDAFEAIMGEDGCSRIGVVTEEQLLIIEAIEGHDVVMADLAELKEAWQSTLREL
jgi:phosphoribosylformylglycinamidine synthase